MRVKVVRRVATAVAVVAVAVVPLATRAAAAGSGAAEASVYPHDTVAATAGTVAVTVTNSGLPVDAVRIVQPSTYLAVEGGQASGWQAAPAAPSYVTFTGSVLPTGASATFTVDVQAARPAADQMAHWSVLTSADGGASYSVASGAGNTVNSLLGDVRVLSMSEPVIQPQEADGSTVTEGEVISMVTTVTNQGSAPVTLSASGSQVTGDESGDVARGGSLQGTPPTLDPGQSATVTVGGVVVGTNRGSGRHLRTTVTGADSQGAPAAQAMVNAVTIAPPAPQIVQAYTGASGSTVTINLYMSSPIYGTENVNDWTVRDDNGVLHPVYNVTGSGSAYWVLYLAPSPAFPLPGATATVTYTPGDLHDGNGSALPAETVDAQNGRT